MTSNEVADGCERMTLEELEAVESGQRRLVERRDELGIDSTSAQKSLKIVREAIARRASPSSLANP